MTWIEAEHGWDAVPEDIVEAVNRAPRPRAIVFIAIDEESFRDGAPRRPESNREARHRAGEQ